MAVWLSLPGLSMWQVAPDVEVLMERLLKTFFLHAVGAELLLPVFSRHCTLPVTVSNGCATTPVSIETASSVLSARL
ncbi:hypothetical protein D3C85_1459900 [compost metagenome]